MSSGPALRNGSVADDDDDDVVASYGTTSSEPLRRPRSASLQEPPPSRMMSIPPEVQTSELSSSQFRAEARETVSRGKAFADHGNHQHQQQDEEDEESGRVLQSAYYKRVDRLYIVG